MTDQHTTNAEFVGRKLAELDIRQGQLEKRFSQVTGALESMANDIKSHIDRTRERRFVECAASRLLPLVYGHKPGNDQMTLAKEAVRKAVALWQAIEEHFDARAEAKEGES